MALLGVGLVAKRLRGTAKPPMEAKENHIETTKAPLGFMIAFASLVTIAGDRLGQNWTSLAG
jgi:hypothetical protein